MTPAVVATTDVEITSGRGRFRTQGRQLKFDGYRRSLAPASKEDDKLLPPLQEGQVLELIELNPTQHFTQPPPRYTEATLVRALKKENIGRPSTYATTISTIQDRGYVEQKERRFFATELGLVVTDLLVKHFPKVMDPKFTSHMEDELDQVANAHLDWKAVLSEFYEPFSDELARAATEMEKVRGVETEEKCPQCEQPLLVRWSRTGKFLGCSGYPECKFTKPVGGDARPEPQETEHKCPDCGKEMLLRQSRRGPFLGCSGYPECKVTMNMGEDGVPVRVQTPTDHQCDKCQSPMLLRTSARGPFLACSAYPKCRYTLAVDKEGNPVRPVDTGVKCEKCDESMVIKFGRRGAFLGCGAYPRCRTTQPLPDSLKEQAEELRSRTDTGKSEEEPSLEDLGLPQECEECGKPMKMRKGARGAFLGCSGYPKCRSTQQVSPELLEQIQTATAELNKK